MFGASLLQGVMAAREGAAGERGGEPVDWGAVGAGREGCGGRPGLLVKLLSSPELMAEVKQTLEDLTPGEAGGSDPVGYGLV